MRALLPNSEDRLVWAVGYCTLVALFPTLGVSSVTPLRGLAQEGIRDNNFSYLTPPRTAVSTGPVDWADSRIPAKPRYRFPVKQALLAALLLVIGVVMTTVGVTQGLFCKSNYQYNWGDQPLLCAPARPEPACLPLCCLARLCQRLCWWA